MHCNALNNNANKPMHSQNKMIRLPKGKPKQPRGLQRKRLLAAYELKAGLKEVKTELILGRCVRL